MTTFRENSPTTPETCLVHAGWAMGHLPATSPARAMLVRATAELTAGHATDARAWASRAVAHAQVELG